MRYADDGTGHAARLIEQFDLSAPPVQVCQIARDCGVEIRRQAGLSHAVSGYLYRGPHHDVIVLNAAHKPTRRRFTCAHELGYVVTDYRGCGVHVLASVPEDVYREEERTMNRFAAELLMPEPWVREFHAWFHSVGASDGLLLHKLADTFRVSLRAMKLRLYEVGIEPAPARRASVDALEPAPRGTLPPR